MSNPYENPLAFSEFYEVVNSLAAVKSRCLSFKEVLTDDYKHHRISLSSYVELMRYCEESRVDVENALDHVQRRVSLFVKGGVVNELC